VDNGSAGGTKSASLVDKGARCGVTLKINAAVNYTWKAMGFSSGLSEQAFCRQHGFSSNFARYISKGRLTLTNVKRTPLPTVMLHASLWV
jgi:hypothetical protein